MKTQTMTVQVHHPDEPKVTAYPDREHPFLTVSLGGVTDPCRVSLFFESTDDARAWATRLLEALARTVDPAVEISVFDEPHKVGAR